MPDDIIVLGTHSVTVTRIYNVYRVWCHPCGWWEEWKRRRDAEMAAADHIYGSDGG
jgi:hypothetical protein